MSYENYAHFIAGGEALKVIEEAQRLQSEAMKQTEALWDELGATGSLTNGRHITAFCFDGEPPKGWREKDRHGGKQYYAPYRRGAANMAIWKRMEAINTGAAGFALGCMVLGDRSQVFTNYGGGPGDGGFYMRGVGAEQFGDTWVISVPLVDDGSPAGTPPDSEPIPLSEFYRLKEAKDAEPEAA